MNFLHHELNEEASLQDCTKTDLFLPPSSWKASMHDCTKYIILFYCYLYEKNIMSHGERPILWAILNEDVWGPEVCNHPKRLLWLDALEIVELHKLQWILNLQ